MCAVAAFETSHCQYGRSLLFHVNGSDSICSPQLIHNHPNAHQFYHLVHNIVRDWYSGDLPSWTFPMPKNNWHMERPKHFRRYYIQGIKKCRQKHSRLNARRSRFYSLFFHRGQVNYILCMHKWEYNAQNKFWKFKYLSITAQCTVGNTACKLIILHGTSCLFKVVLFCFRREESLLVKIENNWQEIMPGVEEL